MKKLLIILAVAVLLGCVPASRHAKELQDESMLMAVLWVQTAAEYEALAHQAYNWARVRLDEELKEKHHKPVAIIADVDETVINNTLYNRSAGCSRLLPICSFSGMHHVLHHKPAGTGQGRNGCQFTETGFSQCRFRPCIYENHHLQQRAPATAGDAGV
jgi:hypothetical protein